MLSAKRGRAASESLRSVRNSRTAHRSAAEMILAQRHGPRRCVKIEGGVLAHQPRRPERESTGTWIKHSYIENVLAT
eukprot:510996-Prymnesium_polylepis.1